MENKKEISFITTSDGKEYSVGMYIGNPMHRVTMIGKIVETERTGEMAYVPWFEVYDPKGNLIREINGKYVIIIGY